MRKQNVNRNGKRMQQGKSGGVLRLFNSFNLYAFGYGSIVQHSEPVAQLQNRDQVVGDVEQCGSVAAIQSLQQHDDLSLGYRVKSTGWFIGDQNRGAMQESKSEKNPLCLAN